MGRPQVLILLSLGVTPDPPARDDPFASIRCPGCGGVGDIDIDQYEGKVSIECTNCPYHETHDLRPEGQHA